MCSSLTEPISAWCRSSQAPGRCSRRFVSSDIYNSSLFGLHFYTKEWKIFFILIPKPAYKLKTDCIISFVFQGTKEAEGEDYIASRREEYLCSSQTEPISACCLNSCRHLGDVYEGLFLVIFTIHLYLVHITIPKNRGYFFIR